MGNYAVQIQMFAQSFLRSRWICCGSPRIAIGGVRHAAAEWRERIYTKHNQSLRRRSFLSQRRWPCIGLITLTSV